MIWRGSNLLKAVLIIYKNSPIRICFTRSQPTTAPVADLQFNGLWITYHLNAYFHLPLPYPPIIALPIKSTTKLTASRVSFIRSSRPLVNLFTTQHFPIPAAHPPPNWTLFPIWGRCSAKRAEGVLPAPQSKRRLPAIWRPDPYQNWTRFAASKQTTPAPTAGAV